MKQTQTLQEYVPEQPDHKVQVSHRTKKVMTAVSALAAAALSFPVSIASADEKSRNEEHPKFHVDLGFAVFPGEVKFGGDAHISYIFAETEGVHFEWYIADVGFAGEEMRIENTLPRPRANSLVRTEFHIGTLVGISVPFGRYFEGTFAQGFGFAIFHYPSKNLGWDAQGRNYVFNGHYDSAPLYMMHLELHARVNERFSVFTAFAPHVTLKPIIHEISVSAAPQEKEHHADHALIFGGDVHF